MVALTSPGFFGNGRAGRFGRGMNLAYETDKYQEITARVKELYRHME
jgi:hypothetical protein